MQSSSCAAGKFDRARRETRLKHLERFMEYRSLLVWPHPICAALHRRDSQIANSRAAASYFTTTVFFTGLAAA